MFVPKFSPSRGVRGDRDELAPRPFPTRVSTPFSMLVLLWSSKSELEFLSISRSISFSVPVPRLPS